MTDPDTQSMQRYTLNVARGTVCSVPCSLGKNAGETEHFVLTSLSCFNETQLESIETLDQILPALL
jgi:hypothetical protein